MAKQTYPKDPPPWMEDYPALLKLWHQEGATFQKELDDLVDTTIRNARHSAIRSHDPLDPYTFGWG